VCQYFCELKTKLIKGFKYKTPKPVAHAARAPQVLALVFNYAQLLMMLVEVGLGCLKDIGRYWRNLVTVENEQVLISRSGDVNSSSSLQNDHASTNTSPSNN
jgi:hypothetical protein